MTISRKYKHEYVSCLPVSLENQIMTEVKKAIAPLFLTELEKEEAIENARTSKVCDLTDTIDIVFC